MSEELTRGTRYASCPCDQVSSCMHAQRCPWIRTSCRTEQRSPIKRNYCKLPIGCFGKGWSNVRRPWMKHYPTWKPRLWELKCAWFSDISQETTWWPDTPVAKSSQSKMSVLHFVLVNPLFCKIDESCSFVGIKYLHIQISHYEDIDERQKYNHVQSIL